jgi:uncharacterized protein (DUF2336 family)
MADPTPEARAETAAKIAGEYGTEALNDSERQLAEDIFRTMVKDAEVRVREALAAHLKACPDVPHDVALSLAQDVDSVSLPMLKFSEVLTDQDLIEIVRSQGTAKQEAVAQRAQVSSKVAGALIDTKNETAVARLVANEGAELDDKALKRVIKDYKDNSAISDSLARRANLPPAISEQLVSAVTKQLESYLKKKAELPADQVSNLILQARERATVSLISDGSSDDELEQMVQRLHENGRLTASLILRALCMGDMNFFEAAMARLAGVPVQNARVLIHDKGTLGLESVYLRAGLPDALFSAFRAAIDVAAETDYDGGANDRARYIERMLERILTQFEDPSERLGEDDIEYLINKLQELAA